MRIQLTYILTIIYLFLQQGLYAQETTITGTVVDLNTGESLIGVNIYLEDKSAGTVTDNEGNFRLKINQPLPVVVVFSNIGYLSREYTINQERQNLQVALAEQIILGQEIVVSASRVKENILRSPVSIEHLDMLELQNKE